MYFRKLLKEVLSEGINVNSSTMLVGVLRESKNGLKYVSMRLMRYLSNTALYYPCLPKGFENMMNM